VADKIANSSLAETTYHTLRSEVITGQLRAGDKLKIGGISQRLSASPSVVREALSRLISEGLVVSEPQRGFHVPPLEISDLVALTEARIEIEGLCIRAAIKHGTLHWESAIIAALHELGKTPEELGGERSGGVSGAWIAAHAKFHQALVAACDNAWLLKMRDLLYAHSERYRAIALAADNSRDTHSEHRAIADAAVNRDGDKACELMAAHLRRTIKIVLPDDPTL